MLNLKAVDDDSVTKEPEELYEWAKLFKATSWEEIKMLADYYMSQDKTLTKDKALEMATNILN